MNELHLTLFRSVSGGLPRDRRRHLQARPVRLRRRRRGLRPVAPPLLVPIGQTGFGTGPPDQEVGLRQRDGRRRPLRRLGSVRRRRQVRGESKRASVLKRLFDFAGK